MSEPLSREEREVLVNAGHLAAGFMFSQHAFDRYEATVQAVEAERDALAERVERLRGALWRVKSYASNHQSLVADCALRADDETAGR